LRASGYQNVPLHRACVSTLPCKIRKQRLLVLARFFMYHSVLVGLARPDLNRCIPTAWLAEDDAAIERWSLLVIAHRRCWLDRQPLALTAVHLTGTHDCKTSVTLKFSKFLLHFW